MSNETELMQTLAQLRAQLNTPAASPMALIRGSVARDLSRKPDVPLFNDEQRATLVADLEKIDAFLQSIDGKEAVALLVATFEAFQHPPVEAAPAEEVN